MSLSALSLAWKTIKNFYLRSQLPVLCNEPVSKILKGHEHKPVCALFLRLRMPLPQKLAIRKQSQNCLLEVTQPQSPLLFLDMQAFCFNSISSVFSYAFLKFLFYIGEQLIRQWCVSFRCTTKWFRYTHVSYESGSYFHFHGPHFATAWTGVHQATLSRGFSMPEYWSGCRFLLQASLVAQLVKNLPAMQETWIQSLGWEDPLEKGKATRSSSLAWRIQKVRHNWATFTFAFLLQGIFPIQESNPFLWILTPALQADSSLLSYWGNPHTYTCIYSFSNYFPIYYNIFHRVLAGYVFYLQAYWHW